MIRRILQLLLQHLNLFTKDVRFQELYTHVQAKASQIEVMLTEWQASNYPLGDLKKAAENAFVQKLTLLSEVVSHCLQDKGDLQLLQAMNGFPRNIRTGSVNKRLTIAERMLHIAQSILPDIQKYAKGQELYNDALAALDHFKKISHRPNEHRTENAIRKEYLYDEVYELSQFIQVQLRTLIKTYRSDFPEFHDTFMAFSKIGYSKVNKEQMAVDENDASSTPSANAEESAAPQNASAQSSTREAPAAPKHAASLSTDSSEETPSPKVKKKAAKEGKAKLNGQAETLEA